MMSASVSVQAMPFQATEFLYLSAEILLVLVGLFLLFLDRHKKVAFLATLGALAGALVVQAVVCIQCPGPVLYNTLDITPLGTLLRVMILAGTFLLVLASREFADGLTHPHLYYGFLTFATAGMILLPYANDLLTMFLAFELTSISTYALPFADRREKNRMEAGLKYFLTGAFSTGLILFGMSYLFGLTGSLYIEDIAAGLYAFQGQPVVYLAFALILGGMGYKMALAPFHLWAADTYTGSSGPVAGYLAGVTKKGPFALMFKLFLLTFMSARLEMSLAFGVLAVLTMTVGNMAALVQTDAKRMLAYSSVANAGTILVGFAVGNLYGLAGALLHVGAHLVMTIGIFMVFLYVQRVWGGSTEYDVFRGFNRREPFLAFMTTLLLLSLGGIPPFLGFWSKLIILFGAVEAGGWFYALAAALILNSALSLAYYFKLLKYMYMKEESATSMPFEILPRAAEEAGAGGFGYLRAGVGLMVAVIVITGFLPGKVLAVMLMVVEQILLP